MTSSVYSAEKLKKVAVMAAAVCTDSKSSIMQVSLCC